MPAPELDKKKRLERTYLEEARRACSIFPQGEVSLNERPDFLLHIENGMVGIEVTELCNQDPRTLAGKQGLVVKRAKQRYTQSFDPKPVDVVVAFSPQAEHLSGAVLINHLTDFVGKYRDRFLSDKKFEPYFDYSEGYLHIGIHPPQVSADPNGHWQGMRAFSTTMAPEMLLASYIAAKNDKVTDYRRSAKVIWLLIVNNQFLGPGEVHARPEDLARWRFDFDFDKVLLFARTAGGYGDVFEIQRRI